MAELFEAAMLLCFAASWPIAIVKMLRSKRAEGKSLGFVLMVFAGYVMGIAAKVAGAGPEGLPAITWLYALNCFTIAMDAALLLYYGHYFNPHRRSCGTLPAISSRASRARANWLRVGTEVGPSRAGAGIGPEE